MAGDLPSGQRMWELARIANEFEAIPHYEQYKTAEAISKLDPVEKRFFIACLDYDAAVTVRNAKVVRELADHLGRADQTGAAHEHLARNDGGVKYDWEILLQAAYGEARAQELGDTPVRQERDLQDAVGHIELRRAQTEPTFDARPAVRHRHQSDFDSGLLKSLHCREKRERAFSFAELAVDAEIGKLARESSPKQIVELRIRLDLTPERGEIERWPLRAEQILGHFKATSGCDSLGPDAALDRTRSDQASRNHGRGRAQHMVVKSLELRVMPEAPGVASGHAHDVWHASHF